MRSKDLRNKEVHARPIVQVTGQAAGSREKKGMQGNRQMKEKEGKSRWKEFVLTCLDT
jgi:hypothetical protein